MAEQQRLGFDLPPTADETPPHLLSYAQFADAPSTMWHGRNPSRGYGAWNPQGRSPVHVGTFASAQDRIQKDAEGPRRPREDIFPEAARQGLQYLPFRIREGTMENTPDMPVSDAYANIAAGEDDPGYIADYSMELMQAGVLGKIDFGNDDFLEEVSEELPPSISETGRGLYYRNDVEDKGGVSAVVSSASDLHHWPTEVEEKSTSPWDRRIASFLAGRGM